VRNKNLDFLEKAKDYAFLLLKFRLRSEKEIRERLRRKKFDVDTTRKTISFLKERGFIDDNIFARIWFESRIKRPLGLKRLRQELKIKGINEDIIDTQIQEVKKNYSEDKVVRELAKEKFQKLKGIESHKAKQRVFGYLMRRGFSLDTVIDAVKEL
jgi:regulatory protein